MSHLGGIIQDRSKGILISRVANIDWIELKVNKKLCVVVESPDTTTPSHTQSA